MTDRPRVALIAEVGNRVGWGHVSRCVILRRILMQQCDVTLKVVNREGWDDPMLEQAFSFKEPLKADIAFVDGLELYKEVNEKVRAGSIVSLSYMSDLNELADLVVAPALNGMKVPRHFVTDLGSILCNQPRHQPGAVPGRIYTADNTPIIGISMGGADVEGLTPVLEVAFKEAGCQTVSLAKDNRSPRTLSRFLAEKLREDQGNLFPYQAFSGCDVVVCQGGLTAIEIALMGIPSVIRSRSDFTPAYGFLETLGCSLRPEGNSIVEIVNTVARVCEDTDRRAAMVHSCRALETQIRKSFWTSLTSELKDKGAHHEALPFLWGP